MTVYRVIYSSLQIQEPDHVRDSAGGSGEVRRHRLRRHQGFFQPRVLRPCHVRMRRSDHVESVPRRRNQRPAPGCGHGIARLRQSDGLDRLAARPDRARPRLRRRHRRAALGQTRRPDRQGVRPGHDGRDARPRPRESAEGRRHERRVPQGHHRGDPAPRQFGGRHHLQLRHQSLERQGRGVARSVSRAQARRTVCRVGRGGSRRASLPTSAAAWNCGWAASRAPSRKPSTPRN